MNRYYDDPGLLEHWYSQRRELVTATDSAAILGLHPYRTALEVYLSKIGEEPQVEETPAMRWGLLAEPVIDRLYELATGLISRKHVLHKGRGKFARLGCSVDRIAAPEGTSEFDLPAHRVVELKTASPFTGQGGEWGEPGTDQIPSHYLIQVQHQMAVLGCPVADVAVLFSPEDFRIYTVEADRQIQESIAEAANTFWRNHVEPRNPPPFDWSHPATPCLVQKLHRPLGGTELVIEEPGADGLVRDYEGLGREISDLTTRRETVKARLTALMGEAETARTTGGRVLTRKIQKRAGYVVEPSESVVFRVVKQKGVTV